MRILTANRLSDGAVVYYQGKKNWPQWIDSALVFASFEGAERCLESVTELDLVGVYIIPVEQVAGRLCPLSMREQLRAQGPSVLSHFKAAEKFKNAA